MEAPDVLPSPEDGATAVSSAMNLAYNSRPELCRVLIHNPGSEEMPRDRNCKTGGTRQAASPIVSFLIRVYNGEAFLAEAISSALAQTEKNIEVIVVDDGSTDSSREILRRFALQDSRVRVYEEEHRGLVYPLNLGLNVARGKYLCILDADDIAMPDRVEKQVGFLETHEDYILVGGQVVLIDKEGKGIGTRELPVDHARVEAELRHSCCFTHSAVTFRRKEVISACGYDPMFISGGEDYDLWVRLARQSRLANLPEIVCKYRVHGEQISSSTLLRQVFLTMCVHASYRGVARETIRQQVQVGEADLLHAPRRLGFVDDEIAEKVSSGFVYWASTLRSGGRYETAFKLLAEAASHLRELQCDNNHVTRVYWLGILVSLDAKKYLRAARYFLLALASSPVQTSRRLIKKLFNLFPSTRLFEKVSAAQ